VEDCLADGDILWTFTTFLHHQKLHLNYSMMKTAWSLVFFYWQYTTTWQTDRRNGRQDHGYYCT